MNKIWKWFMVLRYCNHGHHLLDSIPIAHVDPKVYPYCVWCGKKYNDIITINGGLALFYKTRAEEYNKFPPKELLPFCK